MNLSKAKGQQYSEFLKEVLPTMNPKEFADIPDKFHHMKEMSDDLETFAKYSSFSLNSFESITTAEQVHNRINRVETGKKYRLSDLQDPILGMDSLATSKTKLKNDHE
jgi:hypothetical protein